MVFGAMSGTEKQSSPWFSFVLKSFKAEPIIVLMWIDEREQEQEQVNKRDEREERWKWKVEVVCVCVVVRFPLDLN